MKHNLVKKPIKGFKYNYALDSIVQSVTSQKVSICLSKDDSFFTITNLKPADEVKYVLESDPTVIK